MSYDKRLRNLSNEWSRLERLIDRSRREQAQIGQKMNRLAMKRMEQKWKLRRGK